MFWHLFLSTKTRALSITFFQLSSISLYCVHEIHRNKNKDLYCRRDEYGIIHKTVRPGAHLSALDIKESDEIALNFSDGKRALILYDARPAFTLVDDAMEYLHNHLVSEDRIASAIVSDKPGIKMLGDYFKHAQKGSAQIKVFKTMREAMAWLLSFTDVKNPEQVAEKLYGKDDLVSKGIAKTQKEELSNEPVNGVLTTCIATIEVDENDIACKRVRRDIHITLDSLKKSFTETVSFLGPGRRLMLYDLRPHFIITDDALDYVVDEIMGKHGIATAILSNGIGVYLMADYAIKVKKIKSPLKVFTDESKAINWLLSFKE